MVRSVLYYTDAKSQWVEKGIKCEQNLSLWLYGTNPNHVSGKARVEKWEEQKNGKRRWGLQGCRDVGCPESAHSWVQGHEREDRRKTLRLCLETSKPGRAFMWDFRARSRFKILGERI